MLLLSGLQCIAALVLAAEEQSTLIAEQEWQLTEEFRCSCSSVISHKLSSILSVGSVDVLQGLVWAF